MQNCVFIIVSLLLPDLFLLQINKATSNDFFSRRIKKGVRKSKQQKCIIDFPFLHQAYLCYFYFSFLGRFRRKIYLLRSVPCYDFRKILSYLFVSCLPECETTTRSKVYTYIYIYTLEGVILMILEPNFNMSLLGLKAQLSSLMFWHFWIFALTVCWWKFKVFKTTPCWVLSKSSW